MDLRGTSLLCVAAKVCLLKEMKPLVFCREVLAEILMLAAVQEHVQSAAFVLHQVSHTSECLRVREKRSCGHLSAELRQGTQRGFGFALVLPSFRFEVFSSVRVEVASGARRVPGAAGQRYRACYGPRGPTAGGGLLDSRICRRCPSADHQARRLRVRHDVFLPETRVREHLACFRRQPAHTFLDSSGASGYTTQRHSR